MKLFTDFARSPFGLLSLCAGMTLLNVVAKADKALIVGVNEYPKLSSAANLGGCVNDAKNISETMKKQGFDVTLITNEDATKPKILAQLNRLKSECKPDERFVFYFAGHGTVATDGNSVLLPNDASEGTEANDLTRDELYNAVMGIPAKSHSLLLDSCFSGGLARAIGRKVKKTRFYRRAKLGLAPKKRELQANKSDNNDHIAPGASACYFTASLGNQTSGEDDFEGKRDGVFTHFLLAKLASLSPGARWGEVQKDVTGQVADYMEQTQTPKLSPSSFSEQPVFGEKGDSPAPPKPEPPRRNIWDEFNEDNTEPSALELLMSPNKNLVKVKEKFVFEAKIGDSDGYLVLLDRDVDGKVYLLFPKSGTLEDAKVKANSTVRLPANASSKYDADTAGNERVKAILFTSEANAQALLTAFPKEGAELRKMRRIQEVAVERKPFYTSTLSFGVEN